MIYIDVLFFSYNVSFLPTENPRSPLHRVTQLSVPENTRF